MDPKAADQQQPAKQQIIERVKQAQNILVTVSNNPSVDQLAACIGLTLLLNKMDKHATAVFSGAVPSTIEFLQPEKTIETNIDSLRDFIISLDKSKADKLRYKVEDQVVRIFITPYRTSISEKDLVFSQGDFNVDVVMALGVKDRVHIDGAITTHGRILHDATVVSVNAGQGAATDIGQINWTEPTASSLCEMLVSISEAFGSGLIDNQMATAFLTGIVAETERFRNAKTNPKVMTMAAQLMSAGANQQLIATKLEPPPAWTPGSAPNKPTIPLKKPDAPPPEQKKLDGILSVSHEPHKQDSGEVDVKPNEILIDEQGNLKTPEDIKAEVDKLKQMREEQAPPPEPPPPPVAPPIIEPPVPPMPPLPPLPPPTQMPSLPAPMPQSPLAEPMLPTSAMTEPVVITPNPSPLATSMTSPQPTQTTPLPGQHTLLDPTAHQPALSAPFTANTEPEWVDPYNTVPMDPLSNPNRGADGFFGHAGVVAPPQHLSAAGLAQSSQGLPPSLSQLESPVGQLPAAAPPMPSYGVAPTATEEVKPLVGAVLQVTGDQPLPGNVDNARSAVENALAVVPFDPAYAQPVVSLNAQPVAVDLHMPPVGPTATGSTSPMVAPLNQTPSLVLPNGIASAPPQDLMPPAPPPMPPPLPLASNPGVIIPNLPNQTPPQALQGG